MVLALDVVGEGGRARRGWVAAVLGLRGRRRGRGGVVGGSPFRLGRVLRSRCGICGGVFRLRVGERVRVWCGQT